MVSARKLARNPITWLVTVIVVAGLVFAMAALQPWRLFTNRTVDESIPTVVAPSGKPGTPQTPGQQQPRTLARGTLISHEHATSGTVVILQLADGSRVLRLENLDTSDGPDLRVWLTDAPVIEGKSGWFVFDDGKHVELGDLKGNKGSQNYPIPAEVDLKALTSVTIWCARFHVSFGAAQLQAG
ncbi:DM13 domain-containing protein [Nocardia sp. NPDC052566]|uniref:DM13 domain-containing protein n=1 Tax=Nocardia sp. NPDC052566 TaxID=3364330 RepID=UPI0037C69562